MISLVQKKKAKRQKDRYKKISRQFDRKRERERLKKTRRQNDRKRDNYVKAKVGRM